MRQTLEDRTNELAAELKNSIFLQVAGEADVVLDDESRDKYLDCNNRGTSKALTDAILASARAAVTPLVLTQTRYFDAPHSNTVRSLSTGFKKYRFFIDGT